MNNSHESASWADQEDFTCNLLILGKTGVGKSSLLNYLAGEDLAKAGTGRPVTGEGLYPFMTTFGNRQRVQVFDSWGLEAGKDKSWEALIKRSLVDHGVHQNMKDWFHAIVYCIGGGGHRIEPIDTSIIRTFLDDGYHLVIAITKSDQIEDEVEVGLKLKKTLLEDLGLSRSLSAPGISHLRIIDVCSTEKVLRGGKQVLPFGKEHLITAILEGWRQTILSKLPDHCIVKMEKLISDWEKRTIDDLSRKKVSGFKEENREIYDWIAASYESFLKTFENDSKLILDKAVQQCNFVGNSLLKALSWSGMEKRENLSFWLLKTSGDWTTTVGRVVLAIFTLGIGLVLRSTKDKEDETWNMKQAISDAAERLRKDLAKRRSEIQSSIRVALS